MQSDAEFFRAGVGRLEAFLRSRNAGWALTQMHNVTIHRFAERRVSRRVSHTDVVAIGQRGARGEEVLKEIALWLTSIEKNP